MAGDAIVKFRSVFRAHLAAVLKVRFLVNICHPSKQNGGKLRVP
jgi:hypothetical protein